LDQGLIWRLLKVTNASSLPQELQSIADEAIRIFNSYGESSGLDRIYEWLEVDGWDDLIADFEEQDALKINYIAEYKFSESELRAHIGLEDSEQVSDQDRLSYARDVIDDAISGSDGFLLASLHAYSLVSSKGQTAYVGCMISIHGQGGPHCDWWGLWPSKAAFYNAVCESGDYWVIPMMGEVTDEAILKRWKS
jgi:hypothetical protein